MKATNNILSPGEKKYYGLKYVVAEVFDGKYTGSEEQLIADTMIAFKE